MKKKTNFMDNKNILIISGIIIGVVLLVTFLPSSSIQTQALVTTTTVGCLPIPGSMWCPDQITLCPQDTNEFGCTRWRCDLCVGGGTITTTIPQVTTTTIGIHPCQNLYWFDDTENKCGYDEFCGTFMYESLQTFGTLEECENALKTKCDGLFIAGLCISQMNLVFGGVIIVLIGIILYNKKNKQK